MGRKYTVAEMNAMRNSIIWSFQDNVAYYADERNRQVEEMLRTHMQNGTEPQELADVVNRRLAFVQEAQRRQERDRAKADWIKSVLPD